MVDSSSLMKMLLGTYTSKTITSIREYPHHRALVRREVEIAGIRMQIRLAG
jgi:uncharacterized protein with GYD domain